jgi:hypothetical protein
VPWGWLGDSGGCCRVARQTPGRRARSPTSGRQALPGVQTAPETGGERWRRLWPSWSSPCDGTHVQRTAEGALDVEGRPTRDLTPPSFRALIPLMPISGSGPLHNSHDYVIIPMSGIPGPLPGSQSLRAATAPSPALCQDPARPPACPGERRFLALYRKREQTRE